MLPGHRQLARQYRVTPSTIAVDCELLIGDELLTGVPDDEVRVSTLEPE